MKILTARTFQWWEVSLIKLCLIPLGILLGLYFYNALFSLMWLWWVLFVATGVYFITRFFTEK